MTIAFRPGPLGPAFRQNKGPGKYLYLDYFVYFRGIGYCDCNFVQ